MKPRQPPSNSGKVPIPERCVAGFLLFATRVTGEDEYKESQHGCDTPEVPRVQG